MFGWKFCFHEQDEYHDFEQFKQFLNNSSNEYIIKNEYDEVVTTEELLQIIERCQHNNNPDNFKYDKNINGYRFSDKDFS